MRHDFFLSLKSLLPAAVPGLIVLIALLPVSTAAVSDFSIFNIEYTHDQLKFRLCAGNLIPFLTAASVLLGMASSIRLFSFMQDKRRSAFYFSLGISRKKMYAVRTAACLLMLGIVLAIPVLASVVLNIRALGCGEGLLSYAFAFYVLLLLQAAAGMLIGQFACFLSGTPAETLLTAVTAAAAPSVLIGMTGGLMKAFLRGNVYGAVTYAGTSVREGLLSGLSGFNPAFFSWKYLEHCNLFSRTMDSSHPEPVNFVPMLLWLCVLAAGCVPAILLFDQYKAERSGISGLFLSSRSAAAVVWPVAAFAAVLEALHSTGAVTAFVSASFCAAFLFFLIAGSYSMTGKGTGKRIMGTIVLLAVLTGCAGLTKLGFAGWYYRIPEVSKVQNVTITCTGDPSLMPDQCNMTRNGQSLYSTGTVSFEETESMEKVLSLAETMFEQGADEIGSSEKADHTVYPYDIEISWKSSSGRVHQRYFDRIRASAFDEFLQIEALSEWKEEMMKTIRGEYSDHLWNSEAFRNGEIYVSDPWMRDIRHISLPEDQRTELLRTVSKELSAQAEEDRYHPDQDAEAVLFFSLNGVTDLENMKAGSAAVKIYLSGSFTETTAMLSEWGALPEIGNLPAKEDIRRVVLQKFDPFRGINELKSPISLFFSEYRTDTAGDFVIGQDFGTRPEITDPDQMIQLAEASVSSAALTDAGCLAAFEMNSGDVIYRYIPYEREPDFIRKKIN